MARPIISMTIFVENAKTSDPTINTNAINSTKRRRPILSDKGPLPPAPTIAPKALMTQLTLLSHHYVKEYP